MNDELDVEALLEESLQKKEKTNEKEENNSKLKNEDEKNKKSSSKKKSRSRSRSPSRKRSRSHSRHRSHRSHSYSRSPRRKSSRRSKSRSRSRERRKEREKEREREKDRKRRELERERERSREAKLDPAEREAIELERDARTVFATNLPIRAYEEDLEKFFSVAGKVRDIRLITDRNSRKSKGVGYIEFFDKDVVPAALALSGTPFMGQIIQVQQTQAEKNRAAAVHALTTTTTFGPTRLYVGSLHFNITEEDLRMVFSPFGDIEFINLHMDPETGRSKGYAFVQFKRPDDAKKALQQVNGLEIAGRQIKVGLVNESSKELGLLSGDLDDDEGGGLSLNAQSRALLMQKLAKGQIPNTSTPTPVSPPKINNIPPPPPSPPSPPPPPPPSVNQVSPSPCIVLKNMFDPTIETEPNWDLEIAEDVTEECSKFGSIVHCYVDKKSQGFVYLKFGSIPGAQIAIKNLNGRWFSGRMISASFISENTYYKMFPEAIKK